MGLQCGLVGLPNVGKSTIFNALTKSHGAAAENFPFCTIDPNVGIVEIPDPRFKNLCKMIGPKSEVPAAVEFVDIAGLVAGASKGDGLGNAFLAHIRQVNAILHIVRCFDDENVTHVSGKVSPADDIEVIELELILADIEQVEKKIQTLVRLVKGGDKEAEFQDQVLQKVLPVLKDSKPAISVDLNEDEIFAIKELALLTLKPVLFVGNVDEDFIDKPQTSPHYIALEQAAKERGTYVVPICGKIEAELTQLEPEEEQTFLEEFGLTEPGLNRVIREAYTLLGYITFFTAGEKEVRAWNIVRGALAPQAAGEIHTDLERGFIRAEIVSYDDIVSNDGMKAAKDAGKLRVEGKDYTVADGDVIYFRFNV
ncbi:MAG: redox-regulated ATPase YchF [Leptospirales bacterium]